MDFRNLPITFLVPWPLLALAAVGLGGIVGGICMGVVWFVSHLQWVP